MERPDNYNNKKKSYKQSQLPNVRIFLIGKMFSLENFSLIEVFLLTILLVESPTVVVDCGRNPTPPPPVPVTVMIPKEIPLLLPKDICSSSLKDFTFQISFKKFHVTKIHKAGLNKIYEFRRSKSFFFEIVDHHENTNHLHLRIHTNDYSMSSCPISYKSTSKLPNAKYQISKGLEHFFSAQKVIPRRIQQKYFNLIRTKLLDRINFIRSREQKIDDRNYSTKSFFNFSYKRYRFYFGIYIPCNFNINCEFSKDLTRTCPLPSPFVMSKSRRGCGLHFDKQSLPLTIRRNDANNKALHANLLHKRWSEKESKIVVSRRTGISYTKSYTARSVENLLFGRQRNMYNLHLSRLQFTPSHNPNTAKKQKSRFDRSCRRVFNKIKLRPGATINRAVRASAAKRNKFLYKDTQKISSRINHLKHNKARITPQANKFKFKIPIYRQNSHIAPVQQPIIEDIEIIEGPILMVPTYNPIPDMFIPHKYRNIIPPHPIYDNVGRYIIPGSREWFTYMYHLEKRLAIENERIRFEECQRQERLALEEQRIKSLQADIAQATYYGTTPSYFEKRMKLISDSTMFNNHYHGSMNYYRSLLLKDNRASNSDDSKTQVEMNKFARSLPSDNCITNHGERISRSRRYKKDHTQGHYAHSYDTFLTYDSPYTSDDTKSKESRPLKRDIIASRIAPSYSDTIPKRLRQDYNSNMVAGSSKARFFSFFGGSFFFFFVDQFRFSFFCRLIQVLGFLFFL
ncbi:hypothetical protein RhiirA4_446607 [Rhizophagus irregularis]|uniref:DUF8211 domain-containing protein n=1 Tax=Rhizophagus irregularis TaxID=588596 RepID=A0A2I1GWB5_9GLOM|nr:hypothetical protein RhiirA4_446607 [Rhizophagus irregularis]